MILQCLVFKKLWSTLVCCVDVFDVNLTSFCRHFVDALTSIWCQTSGQISHQFSHQMFTPKLTSHQLFDQNLTWDWHQFDVTLMSFWHHFDVTNDVIDDVILTSKHWRHFDGEIFGQFWCQFSHQMLTKILTSHQLFDQNLTLY